MADSTTSSLGTYIGHMCGSKKAKKKKRFRTGVLFDACDTQIKDLGTPTVMVAAKKKKRKSDSVKVRLGSRFQS